MLVALILAALLAAPSPAQQPKQAPKPAPKIAPSKPAAKPAFPIESLTVKGSRLYREDRILPILGLRTGAPLLDKELDAARDRLVASGAFSNVGYRYDPAPSGQGYAVTFEVSDFEQLFPIRFYSLPGDEAKLRAHLTQKEPLFTDRIPATQPVIERYRDWIAAFLSQGGEAVKVDSKITSDAPGDLHILFFRAGAIAPIAEVHFSGNQVVPATTLQNVIHAVAVGAEYREGRFQELLETSIRPVYEARGRLKVSFPAVKTAPAAGSVKGLRVDVTVEEGPSYSFGEVRIEGLGPSAEKLVASTDIKPGDLANLSLIPPAQERILAAVRQGGYMKATATVERKLIDKIRACDLTFIVTPGLEFKFGKLSTRGLDLIGEGEIKRLWTMKPGQVFNAGYPDLFLNRIREDGIFDNLKNARAILAPNEADLTVDVTLAFNEPGLGPDKPKQ